MGDFPGNVGDNKRHSGQLLLVLSHLKGPISSGGNNESVW